MNGRAFTSLVLGLACAADVAQAQQVQFEFYERTGQTTFGSGDNVLEIGVRARVTGGASLGGFGFNIISNDAESNGILAKARITVNGLYVSNASSWPASSSTGANGVWAGIPSTYSYLAGISPSYQGLINQSGGTFTNNPSINEIGMIAGAATGNGLLGVPGMDENGDNIPDTAPSNGTGSSQDNEVAPLAPWLAESFFGKGQFVDVYHFRYTLSNIATRPLVFSLENVGAQVFDHLQYTNGEWGAANTVALPNQITAGELRYEFPAPGASAALVGAAMVFGLRRRR